MVPASEICGSITNDYARKNSIWTMLYSTLTCNLLIVLGGLNWIVLSPAIVCCSIIFITAVSTSHDCSSMVTQGSGILIPCRPFLGFRGAPYTNVRLEWSL